MTYEVPPIAERGPIQVPIETPARRVIRQQLTRLETDLERTRNVLHSHQEHVMQAEREIERQRAAIADLERALETGQVD